ncbi:hypothetical protein JDF658_16630 [Carboxydocella sp. JDF658]|nr:hypothetical protein ULO1_02720 [Carboxydocella sp. ULO1]GAW31898.1 hypothetical protein JDF658_16630 [Carboxydocella sp. JDF658]
MQECEIIMEAALNLILGELKQTNLWLEKIQERMDVMEKRMDNLEQQIEQRLDRIEQRVDAIEQRLDKLETKTDAIMIQTAGLLEFRTETEQKWKKLSQALTS